MKRIDEDLELVKFDTVTETIIYTGSFASFNPLTIAELEWRKIEGFEQSLYVDYLEVLKLSEIVKQVKLKIDEPTITIFINSPLTTTVLQYGNYPDGYWYELGEIAGYM